MQLSNIRIDLKMTGERLKLLTKQHGYTVKNIQEYLGLACPQPIYRWNRD